jgi:AcrR family transcriptional regulator
VAAEDREARSARRKGPQNSATRDAMLDAAERVLRDQGYSAFTARSVAEEAGFKHQLVYYYFETMDDLILATFRRRSERSLGTLEAAVASERPLHAVWKMYSNPQSARLTLEFNALATRHKALRAEVVSYVNRSRAMLEPVVARLLDAQGGEAACPPAAAAMLIHGLTQFMDRETALGIDRGHAQMRELVAEWLERLDPPAGAERKRA